GVRRAGLLSDAPPPRPEPPAGGRRDGLDARALRGLSRRPRRPRRRSPHVRPRAERDSPLGPAERAGRPRPPAPARRTPVVPPRRAGAAGRARAHRRARPPDLLGAAGLVQ